MEQPTHKPVMLEEVVELLNPRAGGRYVDLTLGLGGHAERVLQASAPDGQLLGIDRDPAALERAGARLSCFGGRVRLVHGRFSELPRILAEAGWERVDGLLADLGVSSLQLDSAGRGFGFQQPGPLDMRMDPERDSPLSELLSTVDADLLATVLRDFGEVRQPRPIARRILKAHAEGRLGDTEALSRVAAEGPRTGKVHPATRVFMALRIWVNQELSELAQVLGHLPEPLQPGGRAVFIAFHSLEDRLVKRRLGELCVEQCVCPPHLPICRCQSKVLMRSITRRPIRASQRELGENPRARSAVLRAAERLSA